MHPWSPSASPVCPQCGAGVLRDDRKCWLCGAELPPPVVAELVIAEVVAEQGQPTAASATRKEPGRAADDRPTPQPAPELSRTFSLSTLFLWVTLAAVILGAGRIAPGLGIGLAILCFPAAFRTIWAARRREQRDQKPLTNSEKMGEFMLSVAFFMIVFVGAASAFAAVCTAAGFGVMAVSEESWGQWIGVIVVISGIFALAVGIAIARALARRIK